MSQLEMELGNEKRSLPRSAGKPAARSRVVELALIAIVVLYAAFLILTPLIALVSGALAEGAGSLLRQLTSDDALASIELTLIMAVGATVINTIFGMCIAWVLVRDDFKGKRIVNGLVDLPFAVSPVIAGFMLILLFGRTGWLKPVIDSLGIKVVFALPGILIATIFISLPFVVREVMPVLAHLKRDQEDAAYTMGAGAFQTFWRVTLPAIRWGLFYGISLTFARAVGEIGAVLVVSGGVSGMTETSTLYILRSLDDRNYVGAYSMAVLLAAISFIILIAIEVFRKRAERN